MRKLKTKLSVLLAAVLLLSVLCGPAMAVGETAPVRAAGSIDGEQVTLTVYAAELTTSGRLTVSYDTRMLELTGIQVNGTVSSSDFDPEDPGAGNGSVTFGYACLDEEAIGEGEAIAVLSFRALKTYGSTTAQLLVEAFNAETAPRENEITVYFSFGSQEPEVQEPEVQEPDTQEPDDQEPDDQEPGEAEPTFVDVAEDDWFYDAVRFVADEGYFEGTPEGYFMPYGPMTRAMFVTVLGRMAGVEPDNSATGGFEDVEAGSYYAGYVAWAAENGIVKGITETLFAPNTMVTREQMAVFLCRYAQYLGLDVTAGDDVLSSFSDAGSVSVWAADALAWATAVGAINGTDLGLEPQNVASRAQAAQIIMNFSQKAQ